MDLAKKYVLINSVNVSRELFRTNFYIIAVINEGVSQRRDLTFERFSRSLSKLMTFRLKFRSRQVIQNLWTFLTYSGSHAQKCNTAKKFAKLN